MTFENFLFSLFSLLAIVSSIMVIYLSNAIYSVFFLIFTFCNFIFLLLVLGAEFFSFLLLIVYVGAIAVLFLFVIMMLNIKIVIQEKKIFFIFPIFLFFCFFITDQILNFNNYFDLLNNYFNDIYLISWIFESTYSTNIESIGNVLYTNHCFLFIIASFILLVSMIGVIVLTMHKSNNNKYQKIEIQLSRNSKNVLKFNRLRFKI